MLKESGTEANNRHGNGPYIYDGFQGESYILGLGITQRLCFITVDMDDLSDMFGNETHPTSNKDEDNYEDDSEDDGKLVALRTCKAPLSRANADTTAVIESACIKYSGSRNQPCAADFNDFSQQILKLAISHYHADINMKSPFPEHLDDRKSAASAFIKACNENNI